MADPFRDLMPATSTVLQSLEQLPEMCTVAPKLSFSGLISHGDSTWSFIGPGM